MENADGECRVWNNALKMQIKCQPNLCHSLAFQTVFRTTPPHLRKAVPQASGDSKTKHDQMLNIVLGPFIQQKQGRRKKKRREKKAKGKRKKERKAKTRKGHQIRQQRKSMMAPIQSRKRKKRKGKKRKEGNQI